MNRIMMIPAKVVFAMLAAAFCCTAAYADRIKAVYPRYDDGYWFTDGTAWADGNAPDPAKDYLIDMNGYNSERKLQGAFRFGGSTAEYNTFGGKSLQLGEVGGKAPILIYQCGNGYSLEFPRDGLVLAKGQIQSWIDSNQHAITIGGTVTVTAPKDTPYEIVAQKYKQTWNFRDKLVSSGNACLWFHKQVIDNYTPEPVWQFGFDGSEYLGDIEIGCREPNISYNGTTAVSFRNNGSCAGHILINPSLGNGIKFQSPTTAYTNGTMTIRGNQKIEISNNGSMSTDNANSILVVTNSFTVDDGAVIGVAAYNSRINDWAQYKETVMSFLTVPLASNASLDNFQPVYTNTNPYGNAFVPRHDIVVTTNSTEGTKTFALRRRMYGYMEGTTIYYPVEGRNDIFTYWGAQTECDYFNKDTASRTFGTPDVENAIYAAKSLTLRAANDLCIASRTLKVDDFRLVGTSSLYPKDSGTYVDTILYGRLGLWDSQDGVHVTAKVGCTAGSVRQNMEIASDVWGTGDLDVVAKGNGKGGTLTLSGDNSGWTGGVSVTGNVSQAIVVKFASAAAQGAPLAAFRADAVKLNAYGYLSAADGVTLSDATRGIAAAGGGVFAAEGTTFAIRQKITYSGTLVKTGDGTVALSEKPDVSSGNAALDIRQGFVKPLATNALDGVTLSCAAKAGLMVDAESGDAGMASRGVVNPMLADGATLRVKVGFDSEPQCGTGALYVPICTVAAADADALGGRISLLRPWPKYGAFLERRVNGDGTVTFVARVEHVGICLIVF